MKSDEELRKTFKIAVNDTNLIQVAIYSSESDEGDNGRQAELVVEGIGQIVGADTSKTYKFLVDLSVSGTIHSLSPKARKAYESLGRFNNIDKAAVVGKSLFLEVTVNLIVQTLGRGSNFKWFENIDEARKWLAEGP